MSVVNDEFPEVIAALQARRILVCMAKAGGFTVFRLSDGSRWRVFCDGEAFYGVSLEDALGQCGQWLEARDVVRQ